MMELRWVALGEQRFLQYRVIIPYVDASGALCPSDKWSNWRDTPTVDANDIAWENVQASGGIMSAP